jgi:adenosylhomocysteine nucleosidase
MKNKITYMVITLTTVVLLIITVAVMLPKPKVVEKPIAIISAFPGELTKIIEAMEVEKNITIAQWTFHLGKIHGVNVVAFFCGVGKVNTAAGTELLIQQFNPRFIIFSGISGGVAPFTDIGDITISEVVAQHDYGLVVPIGGLKNVQYPEEAELERGFVPQGVPIYKFGNTTRIKFFKANPDLIKLALKATEELTFENVPGTTRKPVIRVGVIVTGDQFITSTEKVDWLYKTFNALSTEMEGGAMAQVAYIHNIPWVIIRTNSDRADEIAVEIIKEFWQYAANNSANIVIKMIELFSKEKIEIVATIT